MESPVKLNFFEQVTIYQEISFLDKQYRLSLLKWFKSYDEEEPDSVAPTWDVEKKVLRWNFLGNKHFDSTITTGSFSNEKFLKSIYSSEKESRVVKPVIVLGNLVARGLAVWVNEGTAIRLTEKGRSYGSLVFYTQELCRRENCYHLDYELKETILGKLAYRTLLWATGLTIALSIMLLGITVLDQAHLIDDVSIIMHHFSAAGFIKNLLIFVVLLMFGLWLMSLLFLILNAKSAEKNFGEDVKIVRG